MKKVGIGCFFIFFIVSVQAQKDTTITFSGYLETYYAYDFSRPTDNTLPSFLCSFTRHNEVTLNLGYVKAAYTHSRLRSNLALMAGTYPNANLAHETGVFKNIFEANIGIKMSNKKEWWLDVGVFPSHIGFESAIGMDCWNLTRSMLADNTPYYESGVKLTYTSANQRWFFSGLLLNGWQRIQRLQGNKTLAFGHQLTYTPTPSITLNSSSFIGSNTPDNRMRYFHNFYGKFLLNKRLGCILGADIGIQESTVSNYEPWYSFVVIVKYSASEKLIVATRGEYYSDLHGVMISTSTPNSFQTYGYSLNLDYRIAKNVI
ncbi:MAG: porin, partial [Flammeovirgaceae bacterium]|nr:porin [Flammeovirgaceae bacterium]MDW8287239.1 porin [Flammeovirgaceae bacterium]